MFWQSIALALAAISTAPAQAPKPNIVLILADDMGFSDASCYGGEISTPNLDALAKNGLRFTQFTNTGRCWPTRAAVMTGYYAQAVRRDQVEGVKSGNAGTRPAWAKLLPQYLKAAGYRSYHSGKWHIDGMPLQNGFERSYNLTDHSRHFHPKTHTQDDKPLAAVDPDSGYYSTTRIADHAMDCLKAHAKDHPSDPFFSLVAFTSPHFPVQAPPADVAKYEAKYLAGWDALRVARYERQKTLNLGGTLPPIERDLGPPYAIPKSLALLGPDEVNRPVEWASLSPSQQQFQVCKMAVHAAMVDRMDTEIGRILDTLRAAQKLDNTLVLFLSDNGASAEIMVRGDGHDPHAACGTGATFLSIGPGWSSLCNTPFRRHKTWVHEGGIRTPLIAHWPAGIAARGELRATPGHVVDILPTILELAGVEAPGPSRPGVSLVPVFRQDQARERPPIYWLHEKNRALRAGDWKIVASGKTAPWELYDLAADPTETTNLAAKQPEKVQELARLWDTQTRENETRAKANP